MMKMSYSFRLLLRVKNDCSPSSPGANAFRGKSGKTGAQGLMGRTPVTVPQHRARHDGLMTEPGDEVLFKSESRV